MDEEVKPSLPEPMTPEDVAEIKSRRAKPIPPTNRKRDHARIRNLKCYNELFERILDGWPIGLLAKFVQKTQKESTDITHEGLCLALARFRKDLPAGTLIKKRFPNEYKRAKEKVETSIDELSELGRLYQLQMERIQISFGHEKKLKVLMPTTGQEVRIAKEILTSAATLKMDLGLAKRHIGQVDVEAKIMHDVVARYNKPEIQEVMNDPQSRKKVLGLVERLLSSPASEAASELFPDTIDVQAESILDDGPEELTEETIDDFDPLAAPILPEDSA